MHPVTLAEVRCAHPFAVLGWQVADKGLLIRAYIPDALAIEAISIKTGKALGELVQTEVAGLFELVLPRKKKTEAYRLEVQKSHYRYTVIDPYQFKDEAFYAVHYVNAQPENLYRQLGAQLIEIQAESKTIQATRFAVYAPHASAVSLIGDMNNWDGRYHPMERTQCGHWVLVMPEIAAGVRYKFEIKDAQGHLLPHKADPMAFAAEQYPSHASLVYDHSKYEWQDQAWLQRNVDLYQSPMSIYELHAGSWRSHPDGSPLTYRQLAEQLIPYVIDMGYTHIEFLPLLGIQIGIAVFTTTARIMSVNF